MAAPTAGSGSSSNGLVPPEWPTKAADVIVDTITQVRDKTTRPALLVARGLVYGLLATIIGIVAVVVVLILAVRILENYIPGNVWTIYAAFAVLMIPAGLWMLKKANAPRPSHS